MSATDNISKIAKLVVIIFLCFLSFIANAASSSSRYLQLANDVQVSGTRLLLSTSITVSSPTWIYTQSDGRYYPGPPNAKSLGNVYILIDGELVSNESIIDWRQSNAKQQHSFNVIGAKYVSAGTHTVRLYGASLGSSVFFGAESNLSVLVDAANKVTNTSLLSDSSPLNFDTTNVPEGTALPEPRAQRSILSVPISSSAPIIAMASGRSFVYGSYGDAMWGIYLNHTEPNISSMTWSINDLFTGAETQAPMYSQAMFNPSSSVNSVQLVASESPYYVPQDNQTNHVQYKVGSGTRLITLTDGMQVFGKALKAGYPYGTSGLNRRYAYVCIGTNGFTPSCPPTGTEVVLGQGQVCIPSGHNGVVLFSAKTRVQGDAADSGGTVSFYIKIDGNRVGNLGIQQLGPAPNAASTRTITASYLATGGRALTEGCHTAQVIGRATGSYRNLSMNADLPLLWFD